MNNSQILIKPVISEKSLLDAKKGCFTFIVDKLADKYEIKKAVESMFTVHVTGVTTVIHKGKKKVAGRKRKIIKKSDTKKARVTLQKGEKIDLFDTGENK